MVSFTVMNPCIRILNRNPQPRSRNSAAMKEVMPEAQEPVAIGETAVTAAVTAGVTAAAAVAAVVAGVTDSSQSHRVVQQLNTLYIQFETEYASFVFCTAQQQIRSHKVKEFFTDGQAKTRTAIFPADGCIGL